jgi:F-type H+-transporting ATPase subunit a
VAPLRAIRTAFVLVPVDDWLGGRLVPPILDTLAAANPFDKLQDRSALFLFELPDGMWQGWFWGGAGLSKPFFYLIAVCVLLWWIFTRIAKRWEPVPRGGLQALFEPILLFVRDDIVRANIQAPHAHHDDGHHETEEEHAEKSRRVADSYLPFHWTLFFFVLFCNLIGLTPFASTPTGQITITATLALITLGMIMGSGVKFNGFSGYFLGLVPSDVPMFFVKVIPNPIWGLVFMIEFMGLFFKAFALCIRLFANMTGGHIIIFVLLYFATQVGLFNPFAGVDPEAPVVVGIPVAMVSVVAAAAMFAFEILIAFVQAYVFTLLTATFIGMSVAHDH